MKFPLLAAVGLFAGCNTSVTSPSGPGVAGRCAEVELVSGAELHSNGLVANARHVYWMNEDERRVTSAIRRWPREGGAPEDFMRAGDAGWGQAEPIHLAVDDASLFWVTSEYAHYNSSVETLWSRGLESQESTLLYKGVSRYTPIIPTRTHVYFAAVDGDARAVKRISREGLQVELVQPGSWSFTADDTGAYLVGGERSELLHVPPGGPARVLATLSDGAGLIAAGGIAVDGEAVYLNLISRTGDCVSRFVRVPKMGGEPVTLASRTTCQSGQLDAFPWSEVMIDARHLYWAERQLDRYSTVMRLPKAGGEPEIVAEGCPTLALRAQDDQYLYWPLGPTNNLVVRQRK